MSYLSIDFVSSKEFTTSTSSPRPPIMIINTLIIHHTIYGIILVSAVPLYQSIIT